MISENKIKDIVNELIKPPEFLVDVKVSKANHIQIFIDSLKIFDIDSCRKISRAVEEHLDRDQEDFQLDVSSPGLNKPFKVIEQYQKYLDRNIDIWTTEETYTNALLKEISEESVSVEITENKKKTIKTYRFDEIVKAKPSISFK